MKVKIGVLENVIHEIVEHDKLYPDHGVGCACHDACAGQIRKLLSEKGLLALENRKSLSNLFVVIGYVTRNY